MYSKLRRHKIVIKSMLSPDDTYTCLTEAAGSNEKEIRKSRKRKTEDVL
jgi:hypothetical protein